MDQRKRLKLGLGLVNLGVLLWAWNKWCLLPSATYSYSSEFERVWNGALAKHDLGEFALIAVVCGLISWGLYHCALVCLRLEDDPQ